MNKSFHPETNLQFAWDATSLKLAEECPRKYYYQMIEGWRSASASNVHLRFGSLYATALEHYYKHRALGLTAQEALEEVVLEALLDTWDRTEENPEGTPWVSDHAAKTRENLIRTIVWYVDQFENEATEVVMLADGKPAVELSFSLEVDDGIVFCGHLDRLVTYAHDKYVMDQKAQPLTSKILTPTGWSTIGALQLGDKVIGKDGKETEIVGLFPKGITPVYEIQFNDGARVQCAEQHLWTVATQSDPTWRTLEFTTLLKPSTRKYHVPLNEPVQFPEQELTLDPYVLGVLLGDGYLAGNSIQLSTSHNWLVDSVAKHLNGDVIKKVQAENYSWTISGGKTLNAIRELKLYGTKSATKFIPQKYLIASELQRRELLRGLLLTDGGWNGNSRIYDSMSLELIKGICELVRSLGGQARYRSRGDGAYRASLRMPEWPTGLGKRYISNIQRVTDAETMCIKVAAADGLYITDDYVITHNTTGSTISTNYFDGYNPDIQFSMYTFAGQSVFHIPLRGVIIDAAQIAVGFSRFERGFTFRSASQLSEWYDEMLTLIETTQGYARENHFPMNRSSCGNYGGCPFRKVCSRDPAVRPNFLAADFVKGPSWDPLDRR